MKNPVQIFYVEDNAYDIELFSISCKRYHSSLNLVIDSATTVLQAKQKFSSKRYCGALIDWNLPDGDGVGVAKYIRTLDQQIPIIFLSGVFSADHIEKAQRYSPKACLEKSYRKEDIDRIFKCLEIH